MDREALVAQLNRSLEALAELRSAEGSDVEELTRAIAQVEADRVALAAFDTRQAPAQVAAGSSAAPQTQRLADALRERGLNDNREVQIVTQRDIWTGTEEGPNKTGEALDIVVPEFDSEIDRRPRGALSLLDIIPVRPISSDTLIYYKQTGFTNNAAGKARRVDAGDGTDTFGAYSQSSISTEKVTVSVQSIGHTVVTDEISLEDSDQLEMLVADEGVFGVREELERQLLATDDTANGISSIAKTGTGRAQTHSYTAGADKGETGAAFLDALREAKTKAEEAKLPADFVVVSPAQAELIDLAKNDSGNYLAGGPFAGDSRRPWGLTVVTSFQMPSSYKALVGSTRKLWLLARRGISVRKGYTGNQFAQDAVTIKVSGRFALKNVRPEAFVVITEEEASSGEEG